MVEDALPISVAAGVTREEAQKSLEPIPVDTVCTLQIEKIVPPGEGASSEAPDQAVLRVVGNVDDSINGKFVRYPLFKENMARLFNATGGTFDWGPNEQGILQYRPTCIGAKVEVVIGLDSYKDRNGQDRERNSIASFISG